MVTSREEVPQQADAVSEEQDALDAQQTAPDATRYVTTEELQAVLARNAQLEAEVRGLQGKIDRGLNAIRRDYEAKLRKNEDEADLAALPEEYQAPLRRILERRAAQATNEESEALPLQTTGKTAEAVLWVRNTAGINPDDPRIDYAALTRGDTSAFMTSAFKVARSVASRPAPASSPKQPDPRADSRPGRAGRLETQEEIRDAYIRGELDNEQYRKRLGEIGIRP